MAKRFKRVYVEITDVCNLDCDFCPKTKRKPEFMSLEVFDEITGKVNEFTDHIYLHVKGEPLLHPLFGEFLDICAKKKLNVNLVTNGLRISEVKDVLLSKPALRQVSFSLHALENKSIKEILDFAAKAKGIFISLRLWNNPSTAQNSKILLEIKDFFKLEKVPEADHFKLADKIFLDSAERFDWPTLESPLVGNTGFCLALRDQIAILVDGTVVPCCLDGEGIISLGNIKDVDLGTIIDSPRAKAIYDGFSNRCVSEELCRHCSYRKRFD